MICNHFEINIVNAALRQSTKCVAFWRLALNSYQKIIYPMYPTEVPNELIHHKPVGIAKELVMILHWNLIF